VQAQVFAGEFVAVFDVVRPVGRQFIRAEGGAFLNPDMMCQEESKIRGYGETLGRLTFLENLVTVNPSILLLVETHVPDFHH